MIKQNYPKIDKKDFIVLYKTYVRQHMEYCVQEWSQQWLKILRFLIRCNTEQLN